MKFTNSLRTSMYTTVGALLLTLSSFAQAPEKMSYQAVIRGANNALVTNQQVGMQISILQGSTAVYEETHTPTSNTNGLVSLEIGTGTVISGSFTAIDWSADTYFIKTETDPTGGTNYTITGTNQLLSVPFALYAKTSSDAGAVAANTAKVGYTEELVSANTDVAANTAKYSKNEVDVLIANLQSQINNLALGVGDFYGGGVVFYIFGSGDTGYIAGETHGLIAAVQDQSSGIRWYNGSIATTGATATTIGTGSANTDAIIASQGATEASYAAGLARAYSGGGYDDWFLPSKDELAQIHTNKATINTTASANGGSNFANAYYWSSTEGDINNAWVQKISFGYQDYFNKGYTGNVRAVRAF